MVVVLHLIIVVQRVQLAFARGHHLIQSYARRVQTGHSGHLQTGQSRIKEDCLETGTELLWHKTIQNETDGGIDQRQ